MANMQKNKKKIITIFLALIAIGAIYVGLKPSNPEIRVYQVESGKIQQTINGSGLIQAVDSKEIYNGETGIVEGLPVKIGDKVKTGDVIAVLSSNDLIIQKSLQETAAITAQNNLSAVKASGEQIRLDYEEAKNNLARTEKLHQAGAVSLSQLEEIQNITDKLTIAWEEQKKTIKQAQDQVVISENGLQSIMAKEAELTITSPQAGTVVSLPITKGQYLAPGTPVAKIAALNLMEIKTDILSDDMADIALGQKVNITSPLLKEVILSGEIVEIYPQAEEKLSALGVKEYRVPVIVSLPVADKLKPGYEVKVSINTLAKEKVLIIPWEAVIYRENGQKMVMLVVNDRIVYKEVKTGLGDKVNIEIVKGLEAGQKIVIEGSNLLKEGTRVKEI